MGKRKSKRRQKKKNVENVSGNSAVQENSNENAKAVMISVPNGTSKLQDIKKQPENLHHETCVTTASDDYGLEPSIKENLETLKNKEVFFKEHSKVDPFQRNVLPKVTSIEKPLEQGWQHIGKQIINSDAKLYNSNSCGTKPKNHYLANDNFSISKKCITSENFAPESLETGYEFARSKGLLSGNKSFENSLYRNSRYKNDYDDYFISCSKAMIRKEDIFTDMYAYNKSKIYFTDVYYKWLQEREKTLEKLKCLLSDLHNDQINFNKTQTLFRGMSYNSRVAKCNSQSQTIDFFASVAALLSETASGVTSATQAYNIDYYQSQFEEIMNHDSEITKDLYEARSQCIVEYQGVEEVMRTIHADTFCSTVEKISDALEVDKFGIAIRNAYGSGSMSELMNIVNKFASNACESEVMAKIGDSIKNYVEDNPAALEVCKSAGRAVYGIIDTWNGKNRSHLQEGIHTCTNHMLMVEDKMKLERLKFSIDEDLPQTKLESCIEDAIDSLESEMEQIKDVYYELF